MTRLSQVVQTCLNWQKGRAFLGDEGEVSFIMLPPRDGESRSASIAGVGVVGVGGRNLRCLIKKKGEIRRRNLLSTLLYCTTYNYAPYVCSWYSQL